MPAVREGKPRVYPLEIQHFAQEKQHGVEILAQFRVRLFFLKFVIIPTHDPSFVHRMSCTDHEPPVLKRGIVLIHHLKRSIVDVSFTAPYFSGSYMYCQWLQIQHQAILGLSHLFRCKA